MSLRYDGEAARLRRQLAQRPGISAWPKCPLCGREVEPRLLAIHTRQEERDCLSQAIEQIDKALATWWSTEPTDDWHREEMDRRAEFLRQERCERWNELMATTPYEPGYPHDGMAL